MRGLCTGTTCAANQERSAVTYCTQYDCTFCCQTKPFCTTCEANEERSGATQCTATGDCTNCCQTKHPLCYDGYCAANQERSADTHCATTLNCTNCCHMLSAVEPVATPCTALHCDVPNQERSAATHCTATDDCTNCCQTKLVACPTCEANQERSAATHCAMTDDCTNCCQTPPLCTTCEANEERSSATRCTSTRNCTNCCQTPPECPTCEANQERSADTHCTSTDDCTNCCQTKHVVVVHQPEQKADGLEATDLSDSAPGPTDPDLEKHLQARYDGAQLFHKVMKTEASPTPPPTAAPEDDAEASEADTQAASINSELMLGIIVPLILLFCIGSGWAFYNSDYWKDRQYRKANAFKHEQNVMDLHDVDRTLEELDALLDEEELDALMDEVESNSGEWESMESSESLSDIAQSEGGTDENVVGVPDALEIRRTVGNRIEHIESAKLRWKRVRQDMHAASVFRQAGQKHFSRSSKTRVRGSKVLEMLQKMEGAKGKHRVTVKGKGKRTTIHSAQHAFEKMMS